MQVATGGTTWHKTYTLQAFETFALSLRQLQLEQVKDDDGKVLSRDVDSGQISWSNTAGPKGTGRILISNRGLQMARSFSCASYYNLCGVSISPSSTQTIATNGGIGFSTSNLNYCWAYNPGSCYGSPGGYGSISGRNWSANGPLAGSGNCSGSSTCFVTGSYPGEGWVWETVSDYNSCTLDSPQTQVNVIPTISGSNTVWWFGGQSQSGYATQITLNSDAGPDATWNVVGGKRQDIFVKQWFLSCCNGREKECAE